MVHDREREIVTAHARVATVALDASNNWKTKTTAEMATS